MSNQKRQPKGQPSGGQFAKQEHAENGCSLDIGPVMWSTPGYNDEPMTAEQALEDWISTEEIDFLDLAAKAYPGCPPEGLDEQADMLREQLFQFTDRDNDAEQNMEAIRYGATYMGVNLKKAGSPLPEIIITERMVAGWAASDSAELRQNAARSDLISDEDLAKLARDKVGSIAFTAQKNLKLSGAEILKLWDDRQIDRTAVLIREDIAQLDQALIAELALNSANYDRLAAANNHGISEKILKTLSRDSYGPVADAALANLESRRQPAAV